MVTLRQKLKQHIAPAHERLESHERMLAYSQTTASLPEYLSTLRQLQYFWENNVPDRMALPPDFHRFYQSYIVALRQDTGQARPTQNPTPRNEIGFFYVLIGSSLGAKFILQNQLKNDVPKRSLKTLADQGPALWKTFLDDHLSKVEPDHEHLVLQSSELMFQQLYHTLSSSDQRPR